MPACAEKTGVMVCGRRWDSNAARQLVMYQGKNVEELLLAGLALLMPGHPEAFCRRLLPYCRCRIQDIEIPREQWPLVYPNAGSRVEFLYTPKGGSGKKNPLAMILSLVVTVAAITFQQHYLLPALAKAGIGAAAAQSIGAIAVAGIAMAGGLAINALFPVAQPAIDHAAAGDTSQTYALNGGQNTANPNGYVPLVLGTHRMTPPLGAKSWTEYCGEDQYLHMLVIWGHPDMVLRDFRIGETPLGNYRDVAHVFHQATTGNDLQLFGRSYNEQAVGAALSQAQGWVTRSVGTADELIFDIQFAALGAADRQTGNILPHTVVFEAQCALDGTNGWIPIGGQNFAIAGIQKSANGTNLDWKVWTTSQGVVTVSTWWQDTMPGNCYSIYPAKDARISGCNVTIESYSETDDDGRTRYWQVLTMTSGQFTGAGTFEITASQTKPLTRSYRTAVSHGDWQVRIRRISADTSDTYIYDEATWSTVRAVVNKPAFSTPIPVCCSELRIRASEQLSNYVSDFNALATSRLPCWNGTDWVPAETSNPAAILRYLLCTRHGSYVPWRSVQIDEASFRDFYTFCAAEGFTFNFVADTEMTTWKRLVQVAAAGRGAITLDNDGKFGVIIDRAGKVPVQMFTPRNSWGFSIDRAYQKLPHALRASFINAANDYNEDNGYIFADGYSLANATNIIEWQAEGKTNWAEVWRFGRYYLASARLRPESITLSTDWEWRMCRRGDLVGVAHDVLMNVFGTARIQRLIYRSGSDLVYVDREADIPAGEVPAGVQLDDAVYFSEPSPARYGIAVRLSTGRLLTFEVQAQYGEETPDLMFRYAITAAQVPPLGALASISILGDEYEEFLVAGIAPGDNLSADLTLIPYAPAIMDADTGAIPAYSPSIRLDVVPRRDNLPVPAITEIRTDESVLIRSGDSLLSCIAVWYTLPSSPAQELGEIQVQMKASDAYGNEFAASGPLGNSIFVQGVEDGRQYTVFLRIVSASGRVSKWSTPQVVTVIGKTSPPPSVTGFTAAIADPQGIRLAWDALTVLDFDHYVIRGAASLSVLGTSAIAEVMRQTGLIAFSIVGVDTGGRESVVPATASVAVSAPLAPVPSFEMLKDGAAIRWADCRTTWSISHYVVEDVWAGTIENYTDPRVTVSPRPAAQAYVFHIYAVDIFDNAGPVCDFVLAVPVVTTPEPYVVIDGPQLVIRWPVVVYAFSIAYYEVQTVDGTSLGRVETNELRLLPGGDGTYEYRVRAVDLAGNVSAWGECTLAIAAPGAPAVTAELDGDHIALSWTVPRADLPVVAYDVVRQWEEVRPDGVTVLREADYGRLDAQAISIPAVTPGSHSFLVRAVDSSGTTGAFGAADFVAHAPGKVTFFDCSSVDNNVMIYYTDPDYVFFPIREYLVEEVEEPYSMEIGRTDTHFFADIRTKAGVYVYGVTPIDVAGNKGERSTIRIAVSPPPDFVAFMGLDSLFNGVKTNMMLDGKGNMLGAYPLDETWQTNLERVSALSGEAGADITWQGKIDDAYAYWLSPIIAGFTCSYSEEVDLGYLVPQSCIKVQVDQTALSGSPVMTCKIEVSEDGTTWHVSSDNALEVVESSFRYARFTLTWTGGEVAVRSLFVDFNIKRKRDYGTAMVYAADCVDGDGHLLPASAMGTEIPFTTGFILLEGAVQVAPVSQDTGLNAIAVTPTTDNPTGFRAALFDKFGQPLDGQITWSVQGV